LSVDKNADGSINSLIIEGYDGTKKVISVQQLKSGAYKEGYSLWGISVLNFRGVSFDKDKGGEIKLKYLKAKGIFSNDYGYVSLFLRKDKSGSWIMTQFKKSKKKITKGHLSINLLPPGLARITYSKKWIDLEEKKKAESKRAKELKITIPKLRARIAAEDARKKKEAKEKKKQDSIFLRRNLFSRTNSTIICHGGHHKRYEKPVAFDPYKYDRISLIAAEKELYKLTGEVLAVTADLYFQDTLLPLGQKKLSDDQMRKAIIDWLRATEELK